MTQTISQHYGQLKNKIHNSAKYQQEKAIRHDLKAYFPRLTKLME
jgi:hypothetical protein